MTKEELYDMRDHGEVTKVQFKERIIDTYEVGCELVAFSNYHGGQLVVGINDKNHGDRNSYTQSILSNLTMAIGASGRQQQILFGRRQETLSLARHPHGHAHREGCPQHRDCSNL